MKKNVVRLSESQLKRVIAESVKKTVNEISADLAYDAKQRAEDQSGAIDNVCYLCDSLLEAMDELFSGGYSNTTLLSRKIAQDLNVEGVKHTIENFAKVLRKVYDRKENQASNISDFYAEKFREMPDD